MATRTGYPLPGASVAVGTDAAWWDGPRWGAHDAAILAGRRALMSGPEQTRRRRLRRYLEFYGGAERYVVSLDRTGGSIVGGDAWARGRLALNVCRSVVGTAVSLLTRVKTKASCLTIDGDWSLKRQARQVEMFARGHLDEAKWYEVQPQIGGDAMVGSAGASLTRFWRGRVVTERVPEWEIVVSPEQAATGRPREWFRVQVLDRDDVEGWALDEEWVSDGLRKKEAMRDAIRRGASVRDDEMFVPVEEGRKNLVAVWDCWRMGVAGKPGRHITAVDGATLRDEEWDTERPPLRLWHWEAPSAGVWGTGIIELIYGIQQEMNYTAQAIRDAHHLVGKGRWFIPRTARVNEQHLKDNRVTAFTYFDGSAPPQYVATHPVSAEMYRELENLARRAYEQSGVNQMTAQAEKSPGVTAGIALKRVADLQSKRFSDQQNRYEQFTLGVVEDAIDEARRAMERWGSYKVKAIGRNGVTLVDMAAVDLDRDKYVLTVSAANALSDDPAERMDDVLTLMSMNVIQDQQQLLDMLQIPDTEGFVKVKTAPLRYATWLIEKLFDGERVAVDPRAPIEYVEPLLLAAYLNAVTEGAPNEVRRNIGDAIDAARARAKQMKAAEAAEAAAQQVPQAGAPPQMPPIGAPGAPGGPTLEPGGGAVPPPEMTLS